MPNPFDWLKLLPPKTLALASLGLLGGGSGIVMQSLGIDPLDDLIGAGVGAFNQGIGRDDWMDRLSTRMPISNVGDMRRSVYTARNSGLPSENDRLSQLYGASALSPADQQRIKNEIRLKEGITKEMADDQQMDYWTDISAGKQPTLAGGLTAPEMEEFLKILSTFKSLETNPESSASALLSAPNAGRYFDLMQKQRGYNNKLLASNIKPENVFNPATGLTLGKERELAAAKASGAPNKLPSAVASVPIGVRGGGAATNQPPGEYNIVRGDTLWDIAQKAYGDPLMWRAIYAANKNSIADPNLIYPNQKLVMPSKDEVSKLAAGVQLPTRSPSASNPVSSINPLLTKAPIGDPALFEQWKKQGGSGKSEDFISHLTGIGANAAIPESYGAPSPIKEGALKLFGQIPPDMWNDQDFQKGISILLEYVQSKQGGR